MASGTTAFPDNDPKDKDVLGYFMLTTKELMDLQRFNPAYRDEKLNAALQRAQAFALKCIAPMTEPNTGPACAEHSTPGTPSHYSLKEDSKRGFQLGLILIGGGHLERRNQDHERRPRPLPPRQRRPGRRPCRGTVGTHSLGVLIPLPPAFGNRSASWSV